MAFGYIKYDISSKKASNQTSKKADFTVDLIWWGSLKLTPIIKRGREIDKKSAQFQ